MALKIEPNQSATAFHIVDGAFKFPYAIDAQHAISNHPLEWSDMPWTAERASTARARLNEQNQEQGLAPLPEPAPLSPDDQAALDQHNKAVAEASQRLADYYDRKAKEKAETDQVAADEAVIASLPPAPDPTVRRPLSPAQIRKNAAALTPEEIAAKKAADDKLASDEAAEKAAADKVEQDRMGNAFIKTS